MQFQGVELEVGRRIWKRRDNLCGTVVVVGEKGFRVRWDRGGEGFDHPIESLLGETPEYVLQLDFLWPVAGQEIGFFEEPGSAPLWTGYVKSVNPKSQDYVTVNHRNKVESKWLLPMHEPSEWRKGRIRPLTKVAPPFDDTPRKVDVDLAGGKPKRGYKSPALKELDQHQVIRMLEAENAKLMSKAERIPCDHERTIVMLRADNDRLARLAADWEKRLGEECQRWLARELHLERQLDEAHRKLGQLTAQSKKR